MKDNKFDSVFLELSTEFDLLEILSNLANRIIALCNTPISPVFSIVGSDIIFYSKSITDYFHGITVSRETNLSDLPKIPFWSDIAQ